MANTSVALGLARPRENVRDGSKGVGLDVNVNRHNCRFWASENPHRFLESHTQHPQKLNVWAGILNDRIVKAFFIERNLTGKKYLTMLRNEIVPVINEIAGDNFNITYFQQDGAAPHYAINVRNYLDETFPGRVIGRRGTIEWPPRSPDMSPLDYFLWGYFKNKVYATKPANLEDLRQRIINMMQAIPNDMIQRAASAFYDRMGHCQLKNGGHFEQEL
ncbi:uncharacterized protein LOC126744196 [Anthonomus grandis grandis]|uniref:uncharacterized protein LOC126744196 n=1 Tax=Anthonomus grandis grandis TaxID=2921223 RepID=UPI0021661676|nr:uncharacterized protein LOC126744196 [Anthonomus grandis grandis]